MKNDSSIKIKSNNKSDSSINIDSKNNFDNTVFGKDNHTIFGNGNNVVFENQNIVRYQGFKKDVSILSKISPYSIRKLGKKNIRIGGAISFISGLITIFSWIYFIINNNFINLYFMIAHSFVIAHSSLILWLGIILFVCGLMFLKINSYHSYTTCKKCNREFAYEEEKNPDIEEIKTSNGVIKTTMRYYQCVFCGHKHATKIREKINYHK